jgi:hypothetical protein
MTVNIWIEYIEFEMSLKCLRGRKAVSKICGASMGLKMWVPTVYTWALKPEMPTEFHNLIYNTRGRQSLQ